VRRELTVTAGDLYDRAAIIDSRQRVYSTGLFSFADIRLESEQGDSLRPDLLVTVQERPMRWVGLRTEMGQAEQYDLTGDLSAEWGHKNLFSSGRKLSLKATATFRALTEWENLKNRLELTYTEPWFLGLRMPAWVKLYYEPGLRSKGRSYRVQRFGGDFNISRELGRFSRIWSTLRYEKVDIYGLDPEAAELLRQLAGERIRRYLAVTWERDSRDQIFHPHRGSLTRFSVDLVGGILGGDDHYIKTQSTWNHYQRLFSRNVLASRVKVGWIREYGAGEEVPPDERFYAGGANTVRGVEERSLGHRDPAGNPLGGEALLLFNVELRRPIWRRFGGSLFCDAGHVWEEPGKARAEQLTLAVGLELWLNTPVGPIRVAHGFPMAADGSLKKGSWHFAILFAY
jgi:outer membrane protein assembly factor BamA